MKQTVIGLVAIAVFLVPAYLIFGLALWLGANDGLALGICVAPYLLAFALFACYAIGGAVAYEIRWKWGKDV